MQKVQSLPVSQTTILIAALTKALETRGLSATVFTSQPPTAKNQPEDRDLTLLMGLDVEHADMRLADQQIRVALTRQGTEYQVLYGTTEERLAQAIVLIEARMGRLAPNASSQTLATRKASPPWRWACDKCSDPECEHKLLTDLLARRTTAP